MSFRSPAAFGLLLNTIERNHTQNRVKSHIKSLPIFLTIHLKYPTLTAITKPLEISPTAATIAITTSQIQKPQPVSISHFHMPTMCSYYPTVLA